MSCRHCDYYSTFTALAGFPELTGSRMGLN